ncbi:MAG: hypothetical protein WKF59_25515 [Chitinophagaceae bacterium]
MKQLIKLSSVISIFIFFSCTKKNEIPLFELMPDTGIDFENKIIDGEIGK